MAELNSNLEKSIPIHSPFYKDYKSRGSLYVYNEINANIEELLSGMKGLGFVTENCASIQNLMDKKKNDSSKYKDDYCVAVLTITKEHFKKKNNIIENFHGDRCKNLECKPKLFFFLTVPPKVTPPNKEVKDGRTSYEYVLAFEADLFIYIDTSSDAIDDLTKFIKILNTKGEDGCFVPDELTLYLSTINRPKLEENSEFVSCKPTIHDSMTRRLFLGPKAVDTIDTQRRLNKYKNFRTMLNIELIEEEMGANKFNLGDIDLDTLKNEINTDSYCEIPQITRDTLESIAKDYIKENSQ